MRVVTGRTRHPCDDDYDGLLFLPEPPGFSPVWHAYQRTYDRHGKQSRRRSSPRAVASSSWLSSSPQHIRLLRRLLRRRSRFRRPSPEHSKYRRRSDQRHHRNRAFARRRHSSARRFDRMEAPDSAVWRALNVTDLPVLRWVRYQWRGSSNHRPDRRPMASRVNHPVARCWRASARRAAFVLNSECFH